MHGKNTSPAGLKQTTFPSPSVKPTHEPHVMRKLPVNQPTHSVCGRLLDWTVMHMQNELSYLLVHDAVVCGAFYPWLSGDRPSCQSFM
jgi:hypothetical protein